MSMPATPGRPGDAADDRNLVQVARVRDVVAQDRRLAAGDRARHGFRLRVAGPGACRQHGVPLLGGRSGSEDNRQLGARRRAVPSAQDERGGHDRQPPRHQRPDELPRQPLARTGPGARTCPAPIATSDTLDRAARPGGVLAASVRTRLHSSRGQVSRPQEACVPLNIEDYALIGDTHTCALVGRDGSVDWLCLPRFDSPACFAALLGDEEHGRWKVSPVAPPRAVRRRYRGDTLVLETDFETDTGLARVVDAMCPRSGEHLLLRVVEGVRGHVRMRSELRLRFDYGHVVPWVRRRHGRTIAIGGPDGVAIQSEVPLVGRDLATWADFDLHAGRVGHVLLDLVSLPPAAAQSGRRAGAAEHDRSMVGQLDELVHLRRRVAGRRPPFARHAQGVDLRPHRRDRRRGHHVPARAARRPPQLGLPLLLAPGRDDHLDRAHRGRLPRGGARLAGMVAARGRRRPGQDPDHVRGLRRAPAHRVRGAVAARLPGGGTGPGGQRRRRPVPARRVRRGHGRAARGPRRGHAGRRRGVATAAQTDRIRGEASGANPTRASGRCGARAGTSSIRR